MKNRSLKLFALVLSLMMVLACMPMAAFADEVVTAPENAEMGITSVDSEMDIMPINLDEEPVDVIIMAPAVKVTAGDTELKADSIENDKYAYFDWAANENRYYTLITFTVPEGTEKVTLDCGEKENIYYNYDGAGTYLAGWLDDSTKGSTKITVDVDSNKDGMGDYIQVQNPYSVDADGNWTGGEMLYAVRLKIEGEPEPVILPSPEDEKEDVLGMLLNSWITTKAAVTASKTVKVTYSCDDSTKEVIQQLEGMGYTVKYQYYRSTKAKSGYKLMKTKAAGKSYINTYGTKGQTYYYKLRLAVYRDGKLIAKSQLPLTKSASVKWAK